MNLLISVIFLSVCLNQVSNQLTNWTKSRIYEECYGIDHDQLKSLMNDSPQLVEYELFNCLRQKIQADNRLLQAKEQGTITYFLGSTGSGKSTFINYLLGNKIIVKETQREEQYDLIVEDQGNCTTKIGNQAKLSTKIPKYCKDQNTNLIYIDTIILQYCFIKKIRDIFILILEKQKSIRKKVGVMEPLGYLYCKY